MARKRIADKEPAVSTEGAAAAPAVAPATNVAPDASKARAPRASANAVTHRHKKTATIESQSIPTAAEESSLPEQPTREEIAIRAYLLAESRGFQGGSPEEDWLIAERQLLAERKV